MRYLGAPTELKSPEIRVEGVALEDDLAQAWNGLTPTDSAWPDPHRRPISLF